MASAYHRMKVVLFSYEIRMTVWCVFDFKDFFNGPYRPTDTPDHSTSLNVIFWESVTCWQCPQGFGIHVDGKGLWYRETYFIPYFVDTKIVMERKKTKNTIYLDTPPVVYDMVLLNTTIIDHNYTSLIHWFLCKQLKTNRPTLNNNHPSADPFLSRCSFQHNDFSRVSLCSFQSIKYKRLTAFVSLVHGCWTACWCMKKKCQNFPLKHRNKNNSKNDKCGIW